MIQKGWNPDTGVCRRIVTVRLYLLEKKRVGPPDFTYLSAVTPPFL